MKENEHIETHLYSYKIVFLSKTILWTFFFYYRTWPTRFKTQLKTNLNMKQLESTQSVMKKKSVPTHSDKN